MSFLLAHWPNGSLAASTFEHDAAFGEQFCQSFEQRGFRVTRLTEAARRVQLEQGRRQARAVVVVDAPKEQVEASPLPTVGQSVQHREFGAGVVAYHLVLPAGPVAVGRGAGWEGLLLPKVWENLAGPETSLAERETSLAEPPQTPNSQDLGVPNSEPRPPLPLPTQMPMLFGEL